MTIQIREANVDDCVSVVALWRSCGLIVSYNDPVADFALAVDGPSSAVLVAYDTDNTIVGSAMVGHDGHRGWFYYVAAIPTKQREGIGRSLVEAGEKWLSGRGIHKVQLMVRETNTTVVQFYKKLGFEVAPRVLMSKWIDGTDPAQAG